MRIISIPSLGLFVLLSSLFTDIQCVLEGSGSDFVIQDAGSGVIPNTKPTRISPTVTNPDDEDGDDPDETITYSGEGPVEGSGVIEVKNRRCSSFYCWCVDELDNELPDTRKFIDESIIDCETKTTLSAVPTRPTSNRPTSNPTTMVATDTARTNPPTIRPITRRRTTTRTPFVIETETERRIVYDEPSTTKRPLREGGADANGIFQDDDVHIEIRKMQPLFTHPGILAAVIGGGVVALLCALLLIMFIVYRMRKKDEGSYPLDPDAKPPRLHTYTRAPNKEFYA